MITSVYTRAYLDWNLFQACFRENEKKKSCLIYLGANHFITGFHFRVPWPITSNFQSLSHNKSTFKSHKYLQFPSPRAENFG